MASVTVDVIYTWAIVMKMVQPSHGNRVDRCVSEYIVHLRLNCDCNIALYHVMAHDTHEFLYSKDMMYDVTCTVSRPYNVM